MCSKLDIAIKKKEDDMEECRTQAKMYLSQKQIVSAKQCLRRKKRLEVSKIQLENQLDNFHVTLEKIAQSKNNVEIYEAMKSASSALKKNTLSINQVDDVVDDINDAIDVQEDLNRSIVNMSYNDVGIDQKELEDELDKILADEKVNDILSGKVRNLTLKNYLLYHFFSLSQTCQKFLHPTHLREKLRKSNKRNRFF